MTERAALDHVTGVAAGLVRLRKLGYRIALDDLGAGYAGLSSFAQLEPEIVKVDMSLVRGIHESPVKQKLFRSFTNLCREMRTEIVAAAAAPWDHRGRVAQSPHVLERRRHRQRRARGRP